MSFHTVGRCLILDQSFARESQQAIAEPIQAGSRVSPPAANETRKKPSPIRP